MTPKPMNDCVLLRVRDSEAQLKSVDDARHGNGRPLELVVSTQDKCYKRAEVVAVGPGKRHPKTDALLPMHVEVGDAVVYQDWSVKWHNGIGVWPGPDDLCLVHQDAIVCVIERPEAWLDFERSYGAESPPAQRNAFDPRESGIRYDPARTRAALRPVT